MCSSEGEESVMWDEFLDLIKSFIQNALYKCDIQTKQAIWLQTEEGICWEQNSNRQDALSPCENDSTEYILCRYHLFKNCITNDIYT
jgi:hypothetical protein